MSGSSAYRVLALHGYSQNAALFYKKTGAARRALRKENVELTYIDAPCELQSNQVHGTIPEGETSRGWFTFDDTQLIGAQEAVEKLCKQMEDEGPFDGILAFSQGACLAGLLCAKHAQSPIPAWKDLKFIIFVSSFVPSHETPEKECFNQFMEESNKIDIPTFHFYGATDQVIVPERSVAFANFFKDPVLFEHPGGHFIPANGEPMRQLRTFVRQALGKLRA